MNINLFRIIIILFIVSNSIFSALFGISCYNTEDDCLLRRTTAITYTSYMISTALIVLLLLYFKDGSGNMFNQPVLSVSIGLLLFFGMVIINIINYFNKCRKFGVLIWVTSVLSGVSTGLLTALLANPEQLGALLPPALPVELPMV